MNIKSTYLLRIVVPVNATTTTFTFEFVDPGTHESFQMQNIEYQTQEKERKDPK
jgi:hypothetical protein